MLDGHNPELRRCSSTQCAPSPFAMGLLLLSLASLPAAAQVEHQLLDPEHAPNDVLNAFGKSVAVSGNRVLVASGRSTILLKSYIFEPQGDGTWTEVAQLNGGASTWNQSVALDGDRALTGDPNYSASFTEPPRGAAYVYDRHGDGTWQLSATLRADDAHDGALVGFSVSLDGDRALLGAPGGSDDHGAAYVFERQEDGSWAQVAKLLPDDAEERRQLGWFVSLSGDRALVGCQGDDHGTSFTRNCVPYLFERQPDGTWTEAARIISPDATEENQNAAHGSLDGDRLVVGLGIVSARSTYVFERQANGTWSQVQRLVAQGGIPGANSFGPVDLKGDRLVLSTPLASLGGAAFVFERQASGTWTQIATLTTSEDLDDFFGWSVGIDGDVVVVGVNGPTEHAAYVYTGVTATDAESELELPESAILGAGYPNPFNPSVTIPFTLPSRGHVAIGVYDMLGRRVATLVDEVRSAGEHEVRWEPAHVGSGAYLVRMTAGPGVDSRMVVLQK